MVSMIPLADIVIATLLFLAIVAGLRAGLFSTLGAFVGVVAGALAMPYVLPAVAQLVPDGTWRGVAVLGAACVLLVVGSALGSALGRVLRTGADRLHLGAIERVLGGGLALLGAVVAISFTGAGIASAGIPGLSPAVASSKVLQIIDRHTPAFVDDAVARLRAFALDDSTLPTIEGLFEGTTEDLDGQLDAVDTDNPAVLAAASSVARISGLAPQCGTMPTGSGFVLADDLIVTNAHVVAGVESPLVELPGEPSRTGTIVYFDPVDDLAVIAADVDATPLQLDESLGAGDPAVVQGYPHGGPLQSVPARVISTSENYAPDIYETSTALRSIHVIEARVEPGNSGGPLLTENGSVAGIVFARADTQGIGYAMTTDELEPLLAETAGLDQPVTAGSCIE